MSKDIKFNYFKGSFTCTSDAISHVHGEPLAKLLAKLVFKHNNREEDKKYASASVGYLEILTGQSKNTVKKHLKKLEELNIIGIKRIYGKPLNIYMYEQNVVKLEADCQIFFKDYLNKAYSKMKTKKNTFEKFHNDKNNKAFEVLFESLKCPADGKSNDQQMVNSSSNKPAVGKLKSSNDHHLTPVNNTLLVINNTLNTTTKTVDKQKTVVVNHDSIKMKRKEALLSDIKDIYKEAKESKNYAGEIYSGYIKRFNALPLEAMIETTVANTSFTRGFSFLDFIIKGVNANTTSVFKIGLDLMESKVSDGSVSKIIKKNKWYSDTQDEESAGRDKEIMGNDQDVSPCYTQEELNNI